jgi:hypothetical protein
MNLQKQLAQAQWGVWKEEWRIQLQHCLLAQLQNNHEDKARARQTLEHFKNRLRWYERRVSQLIGSTPGSL